MQTMIRSTLSGFFGFLIAVALFLLMVSFLTPAHFKGSHQDSNLAFNFVKTPPEVIKPDKPIRPIPPDMEKTSTPPAMPAIDISNNNEGIARMPPGKIDTKNIELYRDFTAVNTGVGIGEHVISHDGGGLKSGFAPMYPQKAMRSQAEGWVEVLIKVDINGRVSGVSVLGAEPRGMFEQPAKKAVFKWKFHPKKVNGEIVPYQVVQKIEFTLDQ